MKKFFRTAVAAICIMHAFTLVSCKKDVSPANDLIAASATEAASPFCKIERYTTNAPFFGSGYAEFGYNEAGDPVRVIPRFMPDYRISHEFRYDSLHRLTDHIFGSSKGFFDAWTRYGYDPSGRIATGIQYRNGLYGTNPVGGTPVSLTIFFYDEAGRINKTISYYTRELPSVTQTYQYDDAGNLMRPGVVYDDKVHFRRTSNVWMFIDRDYSMNNPLTAASYNQQGLPTVFSTNVPIQRFLHSLPLNYSTITYTCVGDPVN
ncbi:MAG TPA: hypothetical protein VD993_10220 [Chitinophagaceae bacterium]|nr:hypothetical protein [Chitinophagaceae bacterium]